MEMIECPLCKTKVGVGSENQCPACRGDVIHRVAPGSRREVRGQSLSAPARFAQHGCARQYGDPYFVVNVAGFVLAAAATVILYFAFTNWEANGGNVRISLLGAVLYHVGGKWAIIGPGLLMSGFFLYGAARSQFDRPGFQDKA